MRSESCNFYGLIKPALCTGKYHRLLPTNMTIIMARFKFINHRLPIVTMYYDGENGDNKCLLCNKGKTCDEFIIIFECDFLCTEQEELLGRKVFHNVNYMFVKRLSTQGFVRDYLNCASI